MNFTLAVVVPFYRFRRLRQSETARSRGRAGADVGNRGKVVANARRLATLLEVPADYQ